MLDTGLLGKHVPATSLERPSTGVQRHAPIKDKDDAPARSQRLDSGHVSTQRERRRVSSSECHEPPATTQR